MRVRRGDTWRVVEDEPELKVAIEDGSNCRAGNAWVLCEAVRNTLLANDERKDMMAGIRLCGRGETARMLGSKQPCKPLIGEKSKCEVFQAPHGQISKKNSAKREFPT